MTFILLRSIPLSANTMMAWRSRDVIIMPGHPELNQVEPYVAEYEQYRENLPTGFINLGVSQFDPIQTDEERGYAFWWNRGAAIRLVRRPGDLRTHMGDLLPPYPQGPFPVDAWLKGPGHKGHGKSHQLITSIPPVLPRGTDIQLHVTGQEFRVITVFHKVVQAFERSGPNDDREYAWRGVTNTPRSVKELAREASKRVPGYNMFAWDIMLGTTILDSEPRAYLLEGNSCPGVNQYTVQRIINMMYTVAADTKAGIETTEPTETDEETTVPVSRLLFSAFLNDVHTWDTPSICTALHNHTPEESTPWA